MSNLSNYNNLNLIRADAVMTSIKMNIRNIHVFKIHIEGLFTDNIIVFSTYQELMQKLHDFINGLNSKMKIIEELEHNICMSFVNSIKEMEMELETDPSISTGTDTSTSTTNPESMFDTNDKIVRVEHAVQSITNEIIQLVKMYGFGCMCEILMMLDKDLYHKNINKITDKISLINKFFTVISVEKRIMTNKYNLNMRIINLNAETGVSGGSDIFNNSNSLDNLDGVGRKKAKDKKERADRTKDRDRDRAKRADKDKDKFSDFIMPDNSQLNINLIWELNKAIVEIELDNYLYVFNGYFKEDTFNELFNNNEYSKKCADIFSHYLKITNNPTQSHIVFFKEYMSQLTVKDIIIKPHKMIALDISRQYDYLNKLIQLSILDLLTEFVEGDIYKKRLIVCLLLVGDMHGNESGNEILDQITSRGMGDFQKGLNSESNIENPIQTQTQTVDENTNANTNEDRVLQIPIPLSLVKMNKTTATRYSINSINSSKPSDLTISAILASSKKILNANILMDFLKNNPMMTSTGTNAGVEVEVEYENFKKSIHWNQRKKIFTKISEKSREDGPNSNSIPWEVKLDFIDVTEKIKDKVMEKIKELKTSKDNSKAEAYVESFFKIPFGTYVTEDIFVKCSQSSVKIKNSIESLNKYIDVNDDKIKLCDTIEQIKRKTLPYRLSIGECVENLYLDLIWEKQYLSSEKIQYLNKAQEILDNAIYGHNDSKREIKRLIAQWMGGKSSGCILGFHGPPGVGKTCFAKKGIAKCLFDSMGNSRPFCILQLGGATDGSILEGHSYTYVGAKPGRLVEFLQESRCMNPILYFDELDKVSETDKGKEIIDILIHLTDKSQNTDIYDKYFSGIELDFSKCIIIFSYNDASKINRILRDRITEIKINPLKKSEKVVITQRYTLKEISDELGSSCELSDELIEYIIDTYTYEPGVRKLNEKLYEIFREINLRNAENPNWEDVEIGIELIDEILTRHYKVKHYTIHKNPEIGLVNGLYASTIGLGGITLIQIKKSLTTANSMPLELTGQQGDVMKESMSCAKTCALNLLTDDEKRATHDELKDKPFGLHIHCPDGATPKDGPSAGITITTGIYSVLTNKKIKNDVAMTGEIDLLGNVKAIGGLDAKINGALKAGVKLVIFPKENEQDWEKILKEKTIEITTDFEIRMVERIEEVIDLVIV